MSHEILKGKGDERSDLPLEVLSELSFFKELSLKLVALRGELKSKREPNSDYLEHAKEYRESAISLIKKSLDENPGLFPEVGRRDIVESIFKMFEEDRLRMSFVLGSHRIHPFMEGEDYAENVEVPDSFKSEEDLKLIFLEKCRETNVNSDIIKLKYQELLEILSGCQERANKLFLEIVAKDYDRTAIEKELDDLKKTLRTLESNENAIRYPIDGRRLERVPSDRADVDNFIMKLQHEIMESLPERTSYDQLLRKFRADLDMLRRMLDKFGEVSESE